MDALAEAIAICDGPAIFAKGLNIAANTPAMWRARGNVPAEYCPLIERETAGRGKRVPCERIRPDVAWHVVRSSPAPVEPAAKRRPKP